MVGGAAVRGLAVREELTEKYLRGRPVAEGLSSRAPLQQPGILLVGIMLIRSC